MAVAAKTVQGPSLVFVLKASPVTTVFGECTPVGTHLVKMKVLVSTTKAAITVPANLASTAYIVSGTKMTVYQIPAKMVELVSMGLRVTPASVQVVTLVLDVKSLSMNAGVNPVKTVESAETLLVDINAIVQKS